MNVSSFDKKALFFLSCLLIQHTHNLQFTSVQGLTKHSGAEALSAWLRRKMFLWKSTDLRAKWSSYKRLLRLKGFIISAYQIEVSERKYNFINIELRQRKWFGQSCTITQCPLQMKHLFKHLNRSVRLSNVAETTKSWRKKSKKQNTTTNNNNKETKTTIFSGMDYCAKINVGK